MSNPNAKPPEHTKWKPGQSGNPSGPKPGYKHISTHIQNMLNKEVFDPDDVEKKMSKGTPLEAIIRTAIIKSEQGDNKWAEWLAKYGYGQKVEVEHSGTIETKSLSDEELLKIVNDYHNQN